MIQQSTNPAPSQKSLVLAVSGIDAAKFLQGQLTCDVLALQAGQRTLGAYCNIKGKVESLFTLQNAQDGFYLYMHQDLVQPTFKELSKYALFSKVKLELIDMPVPVVDPLQEIKAKIPALYAPTIGAFFAHDLNLPALGAVSFTKGCYRGQEIVARMQHRGNLKRQLYLFETDATEILPGTEIKTMDDQLAGLVVRSCIDKDRSLGLAVVTDALAAQDLLLDTSSMSRLHGSRLTSSRSRVYVVDSP